MLIGGRWEEEGDGHHPAEAGLDPCHTGELEVGGGGEFLGGDGGEGDTGGVGLVDGYGVCVVEGADLTVWSGGHCWEGCFRWGCRGVLGVEGG